MCFDFNVNDIFCNQTNMILDNEIFIINARSNTFIRYHLDEYVNLDLQFRGFFSNAYYPKLRQFMTTMIKTIA